MKYLFIIFFGFYFQASGAIHIPVSDSFTAYEVYNALRDTLYQNDAIVFDLSVENKTKKDKLIYLSIINPTINKIIIHDTTSTTILGDEILFTKRKFKHINHVYPILLKPEEERQINIDVVNKWQQLNFRVVLTSENTFIKTTNHDLFFSGIFYGVFFMFLLLLICFYIFSKSNFFLIYITLNLFILLLYFQYSGTGYQYGWFYSTAIQKYIAIIAVIGYLATHFTFIRIFFAVQFKDNYTKLLVRVMLMSFILFALVIFILYIDHTAEKTHNVLLYYGVNGIFILYGLIVFGISSYSYMQSQRREILWVLTGMLLHLFNWIIFINNEFTAIPWLNYVADFKLIYSHIYLPQINFFLMYLEIFLITIFISVNYNKLLRQNNLSSRRIEFLQKMHINTFVLGQEEEREKITIDIKNSISHDILNFKANLTKFVQQQNENKVIRGIIEDVNQTLDDINNITTNYVAPDIQKMKLIELIATATEKLETQINIQYETVNIKPEFQLNPVENINLFRVLQELSNNIIKHAHADFVTISASKEDKLLKIKITDNGIGFSEKVIQAKGLGLLNVESRLNSINGSFYILSNEKNGSTIHIILPINHKI